MTTDQLAAIAQLIRMRDGASLEAARLVLIDGITGAEAARRLGISPAGVSNAVQRVRAAHALALVAAGVATAPPPAG